MPIYEYRCEACGHTMDALQKLADAQLKDCPECAQPALKRLMSAPAFRLKGSGWYETDFKSDKEKRRNLVDGSGKGESAKAESTSATSSDSAGSSASATKSDSAGSSASPAKSDAGKGTSAKESTTGSSSSATA